MKKILLIEDEPQTRENLALILRMEGFEAVTASNGRLGLEAATREKPDVILCDVSMPELDGHGVLRALRAAPETASIPFIFLTGWTTTVWAVVLAMTGFGFFKGFYDANIWASLYDVVPLERRATALGRAVLAAETTRMATLLGAARAKRVR